MQIFSKLSNLNMNFIFIYFSACKGPLGEPMPVRVNLTVKPQTSVKNICK